MSSWMSPSPGLPRGNRTVGKALVRAGQPGFSFDSSDIARRRLEPQLQNFLSRHPLHVSITWITDESGLGIMQGIGTTVVRPYQQARRECTESPPCLAMDEPTVGMLWIMDVEFLKDFAQPLDRRIVLASAGPLTNCIIGHRQAHHRPSRRCVLAASQGQGVKISLAYRRPRHRRNAGGASSYQHSPVVEIVKSREHP